jgi:hypothetical protein
VLARLANRLGLTPIPLYLIAGVVVSKGGLLPLHFSEQFVNVGAEIGVILLLFMLGLEYTGEELGSSLRRGLRAGSPRFSAQHLAGNCYRVVAGLESRCALLLGGVTYIPRRASSRKCWATWGVWETAKLRWCFRFWCWRILAMACIYALSLFCCWDRDF